MPHEWISTLATLSLSVLVLSTVTFTTQQYVFTLQENLAEDELQDLTDEIASHVIELYKIGRKSGDPEATEPPRIVATTRIELLERVVSGSFYRIVLNNSTGSVEAYLLNDPNVRSSTALQGISQQVDLVGEGLSNTPISIVYENRASPTKDRIMLVTPGTTSISLTGGGAGGDFFIEDPDSPNPANGDEYANMTIYNGGGSSVSIYEIGITYGATTLYFRQDVSFTPWVIGSGSDSGPIILWFGPGGIPGSLPTAIDEWATDGGNFNHIPAGATVYITLYFDPTRTESEIIETTN
ncbi:MAG: hypothetical protein ACW99Q_10940 [Candidatus Kariarchaeaceae archaeon]|jgi:hypothetical protein